MIKLTTSKTKKTKNKIWAMPADADAIPPNPNTPAMIATIKKTIAQPSMMKLPFVGYRCPWIRPIADSSVAGNVQDDCYRPTRLVQLPNADIDPPVLGLADTVTRLDFGIGLAFGRNVDVCGRNASGDQSRLHRLRASHR